MTLNRYDIKTADAIMIIERIRKVAAVIKLYIINVENFLKTVDQCSDKILLHTDSGKKTNINKQPAIQLELKKQFEKSKKRIPLTLSFKNPKDYLKIVSYYIGEC